MQSRTVSVGPVTAAVTNQVAASQTPYAGQIVLNGAGAAFSVNNVAASQSPPGGGGNLTLVSSPVSFSSPRYVYITGVGNDTAFTFTITGLDKNGQPLTESVIGGDNKLRVTTQQFTVVSNVLVSGNTGTVQVGSFASATFTGSTARQVTIIAAADESANTFVVTGTGVNGEPLSETVVGPNIATATTTNYFMTVSSVTISADAAGALTVGMTNTASSPWVRADDFAPWNVSIQCNVTGAATYTVQTTLDDPNDPIAPVAPESMVWVNSQAINLLNATSTQQGGTLFTPKFVRVVLTTTSTGSVRAVMKQANALSGSTNTTIDSQYSVTLCTGASATGPTAAVDLQIGGMYNWEIYGTWNGSTGTLQRSPDNGTTWYDVSGASRSTNGGYGGIYLGFGKYRVNFTGTPTSITSFLTGVS